MDPFLMIYTGNNLLEGAVLHDIVMADEVGSGEQALPPLIRATGSRIHGVQISNSNIDSTLLTSGDPMVGLEVWSNRDGVHIGQARGYILHMPSGVVDTTTKLQPPQGSAPASVESGSDCKRRFPIYPRAGSQRPEGANLPRCEN